MIYNQPSVSRCASLRSVVSCSLHPAATAELPVEGIMGKSRSTSVWTTPPLPILLLLLLPPLPPPLL